ncbi:uncharacterized protein LOC21396200 [Morus notabilis]|uniref:uncharacterized protein LOC21396200 n=1 Tax=Morus notabilis TaxID=981085 RepID=UPI000CED436A|nr:uncharacterized protein LOC21396200 [Morus notabilis]
MTKLAKAAAKETSRLNKIMKAPITALIKVKDFYIKSMSECSGQFDYGTFMGCPAAQITTLPKSFSVGSTRSSNSSTGDLQRELVRVSSTKQQQQSPVMTAKPNNFQRSRSVGIGRIDEDKPCEFEEDIKVKTYVYSRSKSHHVHKITMF